MHQTSSHDMITRPTSTTPSIISESENSQPVVSTLYSGPASNFPSQSTWLTFDGLWELNKGVCELNPDGKERIIRNDILQVAKETGVDARLIFVVILQESTCLLSAVQSSSGLMQSHNGVGYTDDASILQMIKDGTNGTHHQDNGGDGLKQVIDRYQVYEGLRAYNSGEYGLERDDLSFATIGTASYVSDVANRLTGAQYPSSCLFMPAPIITLATAPLLKFVLNFLPLSASLHYGITAW